MKRTVLCGVMAIVCASGAADAHFVLVSPAASIVQNRLGDPQKIAPCGGVSANTGRGTAANPGTPTNAVTQLRGGTTFHLLVQETVFHPGHYRVALARSASQLPADPAVTTRETERGPWSVSAAIQDPAVAPVLADGVFAHRTGGRTLRGRYPRPQHRLHELPDSGHPIHGGARAQCRRRFLLPSLCVCEHHRRSGQAA